METNVSTINSARTSKGKGTYGLAYASTVEQIKKQIGDLESIRQNLGMSRRQICQILLVNPSAWTRWTKSNEGAPPHFYRALQWLIYIHNNRQKSGPDSVEDKTDHPSKTSDLLRKKHFTESTADIDWVETTSPQAFDPPSSQVIETTDSSDLLLLKRQIARLKWLILCLGGGLILLLIRLLMKGLI